MKSTILFILFGIISGYLMFNYYRPALYRPAVTESKASNQQIVVARVPAKPERLIISKLNVDVKIEEVGMDENGAMNIPTDPNDVAWYGLGVRPSEKGNAVIAGHYDLVTGAPAVFYNLNLLENGDIIKIIDTEDRTYDFTVMGKESYPFDAFPIEEVFGSQNGSRLNLITCRGTFDQKTKNYSNRLVIYSELLETSPEN